MTISLTNAGKRYNRDWIFKNLNHTFTTGINYAITGPNGSGKSTLLQTIAGAIRLTEGSCSWKLSGNNIAEENVFQYCNICAPYLELIPEFTLTEFFNFHQKFKPLPVGVPIEAVLDALNLQKAANKQLRHFSSGMQQKVKLAQAIFSQSPFILLDEPCTNLDKEAIILYKNLIQDFGNGRLIIVSSNDPVEYDYCTERIDIQEFK